MYHTEILPRLWDSLLSLPSLPCVKPRCPLPVFVWPWCLLTDQDHTTHATWAQESRYLSAQSA